MCYCGDKVGGQIFQMAQELVLYSKGEVVAVKVGSMWVVLKTFCDTDGQFSDVKIGGLIVFVEYFYVIDGGLLMGCECVSALLAYVTSPRQGFLF